MKKNPSAYLRSLFNPHYLKNNPLILSVLFLLFVGLYFVFNATVITSLETYGSPYRFAIFHFFWILIGLGFFYFFFNINLFKLRKITIIFYIISLLTLIPLFFAIS